MVFVFVVDFCFCVYFVFLFFCWVNKNCTGLESCIVQKFTQKKVLLNKICIVMFANLKVVKITLGI